jgi:hypothetical protein
MRKLGELLGALTLVGGLTWVLLNLHGPHGLVDVAVGVVLAAGGLVLLMPHRVQLPGRPTLGGAAVVALAGTATGLLVTAASACCSYAYVVQRGWPFAWLNKGAWGDDAATARLVAASAGWQVDAIALAADLLVFAYAGMLVVRDGQRAEGAVR